MKIEFYLDYLCPKCYLQHKVIEKLISERQINQDAIIYRSFEMVDQEMFDRDVDFVDFVAKYKHLPKSEVIDFLNETKLEIQLFPIHNVHKMAHLAKKMKKSYAFNKAVFKAIYEDHIDLSIDDKLTNLALSIGLPIKDIDLVINSDKFSQAVISNKENGQLKGVESLPFLRINQHVKLQGVQDANDILAALIDESDYDSNEYCVGGNCSRKRVH